jgi:hypothetical protein
LTTKVSPLAESVHWYRSKIDWWLLVLLCVAPGMTIAIAIALAFGGKVSEAPWALIGLPLVAVVYFGLVFPMRYGIDDHYLVVRFGVVRQRIPLADISEVRPTNSPLSSPALSLDRLHIQFGEGFFKAVMISPADRDGFLDELAAKTGLKRDGDHLSRV